MYALVVCPRHVLLATSANTWQNVHKTFHENPSLCSKVQHKRAYDRATSFSLSAVYGNQAADRRQSDDPP